MRPPRMFGFEPEHASWEVAARALERELAVAWPFDIALVAAGGYGMLACHFVHAQLNTSAVLLGGQLQLWFGIMGERWTHDEDVANAVTRNSDAWMRPPTGAAPARSHPDSPYW